MASPRPHLVLLTGLTLASCQDAIPPWGSRFSEAQRNADQAFNAFSVRFTNVSRDQKFDASRKKMGRYALAPSRLYRDTSVWTIHNAPDSSQGLYLDAEFDGSRYHFRSRSVAPYPRSLGAERHYMRLRKMAANDFEWITIVDHGIGAAGARETGAAFGAFLTAFSHAPAGDLRQEARTAFPNTAAHLGQLFRVDTARAARASDGSVTLRTVIAWQPDSIRRTAPAFATWVDKYVMPSDFRLRVTDKSGATYLDAAGEPGSMTLSLRARQGTLIPLAGSTRPIPDSLRLTLDFSTKFKFFRVGFRRLTGDLLVVRGARERSLAFHFTREPEWRLPPVVGHLIRTPLRRPFDGRGAELRLSVRDDLGSQTMSTRYVRLVVNESAIMRWLNGLGASAFGDFEGASEREENLFLSGLFEALRRDVGALRAREG